MLPARHPASRSDAGWEQVLEPYDFFHRLDLFHSYIVNNGW
jgi:hypothetical protein